MSPPPTWSLGFVPVAKRLLFALLASSGAWAAMEGASTIVFSGSEFLGNPTDQSIAINVVPKSSIYVYFEYSTVPGGPYTSTAPAFAAANEPHEVVLSSLVPDTRYYYRMRYAQALNDASYVVRPEYTFHTARPAGETYTFVVTSDSHVNIQLGVLSQWQAALNRIRNDAPDFMIDLGDTFAMDGVSTAAAADAAYLYQRDPGILGLASHSVPMYFAMGNHENEEGWNFNDTNPQPIFGMKARKRYFPLPSPLTAPSFYSANPDPVDAGDVTPPNSPDLGSDQYREDYYAWTWGDALFVVFDPFQYTMQNPYGATAGEGADDPAGGDRWNWTLGEQQYYWLKSTLEHSDARYKFMFAHHMVGGTANYVRGGAEAATWFEWGGENVDTNNNNPVDQFATRRAGWGVDALHPNGTTIWDLMKKNGVTAFFHGHDHQFVYELRDGVVFQELPSPSQNTSNGFNSYANSDYLVKMASNSGYLRVTVSPAQALVEYVKTTGPNVGAVEYSYTMAPNVAPDFTITATAGANGSINPSGAVGVAAGADQSFTITPNLGFEVADVLVDGASVGAVASYNFPDVAADHTISASFAATGGTSGIVSIDGAASSATAAAGANSISFAHTTGTGINRLMLAGVAWNSGSSEREITSVRFSYAGGTMVRPLALVIDEQASSNPRNAAIYRLLDPPPGIAGTVSIDFSGSVSNGIVAGAANFAGVDAVTPLGPAVGAENGASQGATPTVNLTGLIGNELVFDTVFQGAADANQTLTPAAAQAGLWNGWVSNTRSAASVRPVVDDGIAMSWTASSNAVWAIAAVPINPAGSVDLAMVVSGSGATDPAAGVHAFGVNSTVNLSAIPAAGNFFNGWTGAVADPTAISTTVLMDGDKTITASFVVAPAGAISYRGDAGAASIKDDTTNDLVIGLDAGVAAGDTIMLSYATSPNPELTLTVSDSQGNAYTLAGSALSAQHVRTYLFYAYIDHALANSDMITITQAVSNDPVPGSRAAVASVFRGLARNGLDQALGNPTVENEAQASGTNPNVGPTGTTTQAHELVFSAVGTNGPMEDASGTWQYGFTAGPRVGTTGGDPASNSTISAGWQWVSFAGQYSAAKGGVAERPWATVIATFKAADTDADGIPDPFEGETPGLDAFDSADALLDFDGDGSSNASEYFAGTDLFDATSVLKVMIAIAGANAEITIPGPLVRPNRTYFLDFAATLGGTWMEVDTFTPTAGEVGSPFTFTHAMSGGSAFYRVRAVPAP